MSLLHSLMDSVILTQVDMEDSQDKSSAQPIHNNNYKGAAPPASPVGTTPNSLSWSAGQQQPGQQQ